MTILIAGIGNPWASDDGVGGEVVRRLQERLAAKPLAARPAVRLLALPRPDVALIDAIGDCERLIVVDAVRSGAPPGTLHRVAWAPGSVEDRGVARASSHGLGVREVLELAAAMDKLPARVELWGVEIVSTEPGQGLSPAVTAALPGLVERLLSALQGQPDSR
jgi:hydrogenase maturation protease